MSAQRSRRMVLWLAALFALPLAVAFWLYYATPWRPAGHTNHGELIWPARPLPAVALPEALRMGAPAEAFHGKWSLVYVGDGQCGAPCRSTLHFQRQIYLSLGRLSARVQRVFLASAHCCELGALAADREGLLVLDAGAPAAASLIGSFPPAARATSLFIVDPRGNLMMRYDAQADPRGLREDLKKLLDLSHIG